MDEVINILVADDHAVVRDGLRALIETEPGMRLIGEAANGVETVTQVRLLTPDVILLDLIMPNTEGVEIIKEIARENPEARILILTSFAEIENIFPAVKAGASGYLLKDSSPQELLQAVRDIHFGVPSLHPSIARKLIRELRQPSPLPSPTEELTGSEFRILSLVARGLSNQEIAKVVAVDERAIKANIRSILCKLHIADRAEGFLYAPLGETASSDASTQSNVDCQ